MIATKFLYDEGEEEELYNDEWAEVGKDAGRFPHSARFLWPVWATNS